MPEPDNPQALNRYSMVLNNPLKYTDPTGHYVCHGNAELGKISAADCAAWMEQVLADLENSGQTGRDVVDFFRRLDAQLGGEFYIMFHIVGGSAFAPPISNAIYLPSTLYRTEAGTEAWYNNLGMISHEIAHHMTSGTRDRLTIRSEAAAYQVQGKIEDDLYDLKLKRNPARGAAAAALSVDLNDWHQLDQFREVLNREFPGQWLYSNEPVWGFAQDRHMRIWQHPRYGPALFLQPGHEFR